MSEEKDDNVLDVKDEGGYGSLRCRVMGANGDRLIGPLDQRFPTEGALLFMGV